jgi:hypothetical protein
MMAYYPRNEIDEWKPAGNNNYLIYYTIHGLCKQMVDILGLAAIGVGAFVATNIDDILCS